MTLSPGVKSATEKLVDERLAATKADYTAKILRIQQAFEPPLRNSELSLGLGLHAPPVGAAGASAVARLVSQSPRARRRVPDRFTRALIDRIIEGSCLIAAQPPGMEGHRREVLVCEASEVGRLGHDWVVLNLAGGPVPATRSAEQDDDLEDDDLWTGVAITRKKAEVAAVASAPPPRPRRRRTVPAPVVVRRTDDGLVAPRAIAGFEVPPVGLGGMRLSTKGRPARRESLEILRVALEGGCRFIDTADVYCTSHEDLHHNETLIAEALAAFDRPDEVLVATKVGLARPGGKWVNDGRPESIVAACEGSLVALGLEQLPLLQLHAFDRRVPLAETVGALAELASRGLVRHVGLCNVTRAELEEALTICAIASVQNQCSPFAAKSMKDGTFALCAERGIAFVCHSPVGGYRARKKAGKHELLAKVARRHGATGHEVALAWLLTLGTDNLLVIPGTTRLESAQSSLRALGLTLTREDIAELDAEFPQLAQERAWTAPEIEPRPEGESEVLLVMGSPASGKSSRVDPYVEAGYLRLNRDEIGGSLKGLIPHLEAGVADGHRRFVMDNTYPSVSSRKPVIEAANRHDIPVTCHVMDISVDDAVINAARRIVQKHGRLLDPDELTAGGKEDPNRFPPHVLFGWPSKFEEPTYHEGLADVGYVPFRRQWGPEFTNKALFLDYDGTLRKSKRGVYPREPDDIVILHNRTTVLSNYVENGWKLVGVSNQSGVASGQLTREQARELFNETNRLLEHDIDVEFCPHASARVECYCRKPMPGLGVLFIEKYQLDPSACIMVGDLDSDRQFAARLGLRFVHADDFFGEQSAGGS